MTTRDVDGVVRDHVRQLYEEHRDWLRGWVRGHLGSPLSGSTDAADVVQDTFLRLLTGHPSEPLRQPRAYLATIARGLLIDRHRRHQLEQAYLQALAARPEPLALSPEEQAIILETLHEIDDMLCGLGQRTRQVLLMAQIEGATYPEIGRRLGISVTTVKKHLERALYHCLLLSAS